MLASPLLAGNDLTTMSAQTKAILTNKEMIAIDQDPLVYQARRLQADNGLEVWARPLQSTMSGHIAVALFNRSATKQTIRFNIDSVGLDATKGFTMTDVWAKTFIKKQTTAEQQMEVPPHGIVVLKIDGVAPPFNIFQKQ